MVADVMLRMGHQPNQRFRNSRRVDLVEIAFVLIDHQRVRAEDLRESGHAPGLELSLCIPKGPQVGHANQFSDSSTDFWTRAIAPCPNERVDATSALGFWKLQFCLEIEDEAARTVRLVG